MPRSCSKMFECLRRTFCWVLGEDSRLLRLVTEEQYEHSKVGNCRLLLLVRKRFLKHRQVKIRDKKEQR